MSSILAQSPEIKSSKRICSIEGCDHRRVARGYCKRHYRRLMLYGDPTAGLPLRPDHYPEKCTIEGCDRKYVANGFCGMHNQKFKIYGDPLHVRKLKRDEKCIVEGCNNKQHASGYCNKHYIRVSKYGDAKITSRAENGEGVITDAGYLSLLVPDHPNASKYGRIFEHRYVMSQMIGRPLLKTETVHHKNGDKLDNRPENLELWCKNHSDGQRVSDLLAWAYQIIALYESGQDV